MPSLGGALTLSSTAFMFLKFSFTSVNLPAKDLRFSWAALSASSSLSMAMSLLAGFALSISLLWPPPPAVPSTYMPALAQPRHSITSAAITDWWLNSIYLKPEPLEGVDDILLGRLGLGRIPEGLAPYLHVPEGADEDDVLLELRVVAERLRQEYPAELVYGAVRGARIEEPEERLCVLLELRKEGYLLLELLPFGERIGDKAVVVSSDDKARVIPFVQGLPEARGYAQPALSVY